MWNLPPPGKERRREEEEVLRRLLTPEGFLPILHALEVYTHPSPLKLLLFINDTDSPSSVQKMSLEKHLNNGAITEVKIQ